MFGHQSFTTNCLAWIILIGLLHMFHEFTCTDIMITGVPRGTAPFFNEGTYLGYMCTITNAEYMTNVTIYQKNPPAILNYTTAIGNFTLEYYQKMDRYMNLRVIYCNCSAYDPTIKEKCLPSKDIWYKIGFNPNNITLSAQPTQRTFQVGQSVKLTCETSAGYPKSTSGNITVIWTKNGTPLVPSSREQISVDDGYRAVRAVSNLALTVDRSMHNAEYMCYVKGIPKLKKAYSFQVLFKPMLINQSSPEVIFSRGETELQLYVFANPTTVIVNWYKDGSLLTDPDLDIDVYDVTNIVKIQLEIEINNEDSIGVYTCSVRNSVGEMKFTFDVQMASKGSVVLYIIIGASVGGFVAVILVIIICGLCCCRKKEKTPDKNKETADKVLQRTDECNVVNEQAENKDSPPPTAERRAGKNQYVPEPRRYENWGPGNVEVDSSHLKVIQVLHEGRFFNIALAKPKRGCGIPHSRRVILKTANNKEGEELLKPHSAVFRNLPLNHYIVACRALLSGGGFVMDHYLHSDLRTYLQTKRSDYCVPATQLLEFIHQIAKACDFLVKQQPQLLVHCLSASDVLINEELKCKISGFATSHDIIERDRRERDLQVYECDRWRAPEVLEYCTHTDMSDVWSFGMLMFEIVTYGDHPYGQLLESNVKSYIIQSNVEHKPSHISQQLYAIMESCWQWNPTDRPPFEQLITTIEDMKMYSSEHIDIDSLERHVKSMSIQSTNSGYLKPVPLYENTKNKYKKHSNHKTEYTDSKPQLPPRTGRYRPEEVHAHTSHHNNPIGQSSHGANNREQYVTKKWANSLKRYLQNRKIMTDEED